MNVLDHPLGTPAHAPPDWHSVTAAQLIAHILDRYHAVHREQFPELIRLARKVERVHGDHPACPHGLADHLSDMWQELDSHMMKEEQILFPMLARGLDGPAQGPIAVMRHEHDQHEAALSRLEDLTRGLALPDGACRTWRALVLGLTGLRDDLLAHIHLENTVLFAGRTARECSNG